MAATSVKFDDLEMRWEELRIEIPHHRIRAPSLKGFVFIDIASFAGDLGFLSKHVGQRLGGPPFLIVHVAF